MNPSIYQLFFDVISQRLIFGLVVCACFVQQQQQEPPRIVCDDNDSENIIKFIEAFSMKIKPNSIRTNEYSLELHKNWMWWWWWWCGAFVSQTIDATCCWSSVNFVLFDWSNRPCDCIVIHRLMLSHSLPSSAGASLSLTLFLSMGGPKRIANTPTMQCNE